MHSRRRRPPRRSAENMIGIKSILCPTDFSEHAGEALAWAISVAKWSASEITVLHVAPPSLPPQAFAPPRSLEPRPRAHLLENLARFARPVEESGVRLHVLLDEGI